MRRLLMLIEVTRHTLTHVVTPTCTHRQVSINLDDSMLPTDGGVPLDQDITIYTAVMT